MNPSEITGWENLTANGNVYAGTVRPALTKQLMTLPIDFDETTRLREENRELREALAAMVRACGYALGQLKGSKPLSPIHASSLRADIQIIGQEIASAKAILAQTNEKEQA